MSLFIIMVSYHIFNLWWLYNCIHFRVRFLPIKILLQTSKMITILNNCGLGGFFCTHLLRHRESWTSLHNTDGLFDTRVLRKYWPYMLAVEWYYSDADLDHNGQDIYVLTQLSWKSCTAKKSLRWLWHHLWQGKLELNTIPSYINMIITRNWHF